LANHEDIQTQQMFATAIGAKPILTKLCESLEKINKEGCRIPGISLTDPRAQSVLAVLSLYNDLSSSHINELIEELSNNFQRYKASYRDLQPGDQAPLPVDTSLWRHFTDNALTDGVETDTSPPMWESFNDSHPAIKDLPNPNRSSAITALTYAKQAYQRFILSGQTENGKRDVDLLFCAHSMLYEQLGERWLSGLNPNFPESLRVETPISHLPPSRDSQAPHKELCNMNLPYEERDAHGADQDTTSANAEFRALLDTRIVDAHAELLFKSASLREKSRFKQRIRAIAQAFFNSRQAQLRMLEVSLTVLARQPLDKQVLDSGGQVRMRDKDGALLESAAEMAFQLTRERYLWYGLENANHRPLSSCGLQCQLKARLGADYNILYAPNKNKPFQEQLHNIWRSLLLDGTGHNAQELLIANSDLIAGFREPDNFNPDVLVTETAPKANKEYTADRIKWMHKDGQQRRFGISIGRDPATLEALTPAFESFTEATSSLLSRGREPIGLDTLHERYLQTPKATVDSEAKGDTGVLEEAQAKLTDALVRFAQKVLFLANNSLLIEDEDDTEVYRQVLQSVGNSILSQADELRQRQAHEHMLVRQRSSELSAAIYALSPSDSESLAALANGLRDDISRASEEIDSLEKEASRIPASIQSLEKEIEKGENEAKQLKSDYEGRQADYRAVSAAKQVLASATDIKSPSPDAGRLLTYLKDKLGTGNISPGTMLDEIDAWLLREYQRRDTMDPNMPEAQRYVKKLKASSANLTDKPVAALYADILVILKDDLDQAEGSLEKGRTNLKVAENKLDAKKAEVSRSKAELTRIDSERPKKTERKNTLAYTLNVATINGGQTLAQRSNKASGAMFIDDLLNSVETSIKEEKDDQIRTKLLSARNELRNRRSIRPLGIAHQMRTLYPESNSSPSIDGKGDERDWNSKDVLDTVIASLRHQYIQEVSINGKAGGRSPKLQEALKAAWDLRSELIYLRPSGAYLRSSYPTTALQKNPSLEWNNLIAQNTIRNLPIISPLYRFMLFLCPARWCEDDVSARTIRTQAEIDKQYWQNINKIRLTGGGYTNYVVAKDDIGNWYVKEVATDPEDIIKAAKSLATFGLGNAANIPLVVKAGKNSEAAQSSLLEGEDKKSKVHLVFQRYKSEYDKAGLATVEDLKKDLAPGGMRENISSGWAGNANLETVRGRLNVALEQAGKHLDSALATLKSLSTEDSTEATLGVISSLNAIRRFHSQLRSNIREFNLGPVTSEALLPVNDVSLNRLEAIIKQRQAAIRQYETSVVFVGDVVREEGK
jgi:archaellum component FlaC